MRQELIVAGPRSESASTHAIFESLSAENYDRFIMRQQTTATALASRDSESGTCLRQVLAPDWGSWAAEYAQDIDFRQVMRQLINHFFVELWLGDYVAVASRCVDVPATATVAAAAVAASDGMLATC